MLEPMLFRVLLSAGGDGSYSHPGEEFIYIRKGALEIWLGEPECHLLREGGQLLVREQCRPPVVQSIG